MPPPGGAPISRLICFPAKNDAASLIGLVFVSALIARMDANDKMAAHSAARFIATTSCSSTRANCLMQPEFNLGSSAYQRPYQLSWHDRSTHSRALPGLRSDSFPHPAHASKSHSK